MKKQYTTEVAYSRNTKVTFYENGSEVYHNVVADYNLSGYLEAKEEEGWERAYSKKQMNDVIDKVESLEDSLSWWENHLEEIKANLIEEV